ncbi:MAG: T9SS type A sorting domain-containing protein, partial [Ichthyobacteriaceae bacterium]|nr:T9SS type A sorting domain-containing protein [Ichthyobacteriaceae bacterium]
LLSNSTLELNQVSIYPNPISSDNILSISTKEENGFNYSIFTSNGKIVISGSTKNKIQNIDVSILDKGIYILKVTSDNKIVNLKFIK